MKRRVVVFLPAIFAFSACQSASFESLGLLQPSSSERLPPTPDAGKIDATPGPMAIDASVPKSPVDPTAGASAGSPAVAAVSGSGGMSAGSGSAGAPASLIGDVDGMPFTAQAGYVAGLSEEYRTTILYLFDSAVSCDQISTFAWLSQLPTTVHVIEVRYPTSAATGSPVAGASVGYARGGMYSFSKTRASALSLVLSSSMQNSSVDGTLSATFSSGGVEGLFHADFCATGIVL